MATVEHQGTEKTGYPRPKHASLETQCDHVDVCPPEQKGNFQICELEDVNDPRNWSQWKVSLFNYTGNNTFIG